MSLIKAVTSSLRCNGCRLAVIRSFASLSGVNLRIQDEFPAAIRRSSQGQRRAFTSTSTSLSRGRAHDKDEFLDEDGLVEGQCNLPPSSQQDIPVPWYLQVERPKPQFDDAHPLAERQRIPDLPEHPPPILQELLEHISVDLGLDDLNILDLRHLDPPAALGSKLLMIVGTARSEKHLHVSADRFCRWLRSTHKLRPHAAGLLGRNELKLKLRRKARRSKLMANVGASETSSSLDDGIRTGWICVTVGRVEAAEGDRPIAEEREGGGFVGFGRRTDGVNVVVQMFTEEKRVETDLEGLWEGVLRRAAKETERGKEELESQQQSDGPTPMMIQGLGECVTASPAQRQPHTGSSFPKTSNVQSVQQIRRLHTVGINPRTGPLEFPFAPSTSSMTTRLFGRSQHTDVASTAMDSKPAKNPKPAGKPKSHRAFGLLLADLKNIPVERALESLGWGFKDRDSTPFLKSFHEMIPRVYREVYHFEAWVDLVAEAINMKARGYNAGNINQIFLKTHIAALLPTEHMYTTAIKAFLTQHEEFTSRGIERLDSLEKALNYLEEMEALGYNPYTPEIILLFHQAVSPKISQHPSFENTSNSVAAAKLARSTAKQRRGIRRFLDIFELEPRDQSTYNFLLQTYAGLNDWLGFWDVWDGMARRMMPRSAQLYQTVYACTSVTGQEGLCKFALRKCMDSMGRELPPVALEDLGGKVAEAVLRCLKVAEPKAGEEEALGVVDAEWVRLWRRCQWALGREASA